jgi:hypothetical protein
MLLLLFSLQSNINYLLTVLLLNSNQGLQDDVTAIENNPKL